jgi:hypothetical protein
MIDGSPDNNIFDLIFGYNGLSRLFGGGGPGGSAGPAGGGGGANFSGSAGTLRLFNDVMGGQASWLLPAALVALVACAWAGRRAPRTDRTRAALILWGGWLVVTAAVFSYSQGIIHTYYAVALAPAIGALVAIAAVAAWRRRDSIAVRGLVAAVVGATGAWSYILLDRTPSFDPWLRPVVLAATAVALVGLICAPRARRWLTLTGVALAIACVGGEVAYAVQTVTSSHTGSVPSAGPSVTSAASAFVAGRRAAFPGGPPGGLGGTSARRPSALFRRGGAQGRAAGVPGAGRALGGGGGASASVPSALVRALESGAGSYRWFAATEGSNSAAGYELATGGDPVMAIGGFNGNGGNLGLAQFISDVRSRAIHYFVAGGGSGGAGVGGGGTSRAITSWVAAHFTAQTIGGVTLFDLSRG